MTAKFSDLVIKTQQQTSSQLDNLNLFELIKQHFHRVCENILRLEREKYEHLEQLLADFSSSTFVKKHPFPDNDCLLIFYKLLREDGRLLEFASDELKKNDDLAFIAVNHWYRSGIKFVSQEILAKREFALKVAKLQKVNLCTFEYFKDFHDDEEVARLAIENQNEAYRYLSNRLKNQREFVVKALGQNGLMLQYVPEHFKDRELCILALKSMSKEQYIIHFIPHELRMDKEIILLSVKKSEKALSHVPKEFIYEREFFLELVKWNPMALNYGPIQFKKDREIILEAVKRNGNVISCLDNSLKNDKEIATLALKEDIRAIRHMNSELATDKEMLFSSITSSFRVEALYYNFYSPDKYDDGFLTDLIYSNTDYTYDFSTTLHAELRSKLFEADPYATLECTREDIWIMALVRLDSETGMDFLFRVKPELTEDMEFIRRALHFHASAFQYASEELRNDRDLAMEAIRYDYKNYQYVSKELLNDREIVEYILLKDGSFYSTISDESLRNDRDLFVMAMNNTKQDIWGNIGYKLKEDNDLVLEYVKSTSKIASIPIDFRNSREIVEIAIEGDASEFVHASRKLRMDRDLAIMAIRCGIGLEDIIYSPLDRELYFEACKINGNNLEFVPFEYQDNEELVELAVRHTLNGGSFKFASPRLKNNRDFVGKLIKIDPKIIEHISDELKDDKQIVLSVINELGVCKYNVLKEVSYDLKNDRDVVIAAIKSYPESFRYASYELMNDPEILELAIAKNGHSITKYLYSDIKREIVMEAVRNGLSLLDLPFDLREDREIALLAVNTDIDSLKYTSLKNSREFLLDIELCDQIIDRSYNILCIPLKFRSDREIVLKFLEKSGESIALISEELRKEMNKNKEIMLKAIKTSHLAFLYASEELQQDYQFISESLETNGHVFKHLITTQYYTNRELILKSVNQDGNVLQYIPKEFMKDREIILTAVKSKGESINQCCYEMRNDMDLLSKNLKKKFNNLISSCSCASGINNVHSHHQEKKSQIVDAPKTRKVYRDEKSKQSVAASENVTSNQTKKQMSSSAMKDEVKETPQISPKKTNNHQEKLETKEKKNSTQSLKENTKKQSAIEINSNEVKSSEMKSHSVDQDLKKVDSVAFSFIKSLLPKRFAFSSEIDKKEQDQLEILSSYLPQHLLYQLEDSESTDLVMGTSYETCVLMIDISGFTPLTESLSKQPNGVELLTKYINGYFTGLIEYIYSYSGDIEKFAGDAIICQFCNRRGQNKSLKELVLSAMECALSIQKNDKLRFFKVNDSLSLQIHCGISIGSLTTHHIGGVSNYFLRISSGHALLEMGSALGNSKVGELCLTKEAYEVVKNSCTCKKVEGIEEDAYLAIDLSDTVVDKSNLEPVNITPKLSQAIKQFISPSVRNKIMARQEDWLNEIKQLSVGFLSIIDSNTYPSVVESNNAYQDYISLVQNILEKYEGFIANLLSDEKGTILVFCFGYPLAHTNDPLRAVKAGIEIREQLSELGIKGGLGISSGKCFIGNVGSMYRKEFTIYGDKVNLSARLMKESEKHDGMVLCEDDTYSKLKGAKIELLDPIKVKGKSNLINICKVLSGELSAKQTYYNAKKAGSELVTETEVDDKIDLIGRQSVFKAIEAIVEAKVKEFDDVNAIKDSSKVITIRGDVGLGKTDLLTRLSDIWKTKIATVYVAPPQFETPYYSMHSNIKICFCESMAKKKNIELDYSNVENIYKTISVQEKEDILREKITDESDIANLYILNSVFGVKFKSTGELLTKEQIVDISSRIMCKFLVACWVSMGYGSQPWFMLCDDYQYTDPFSRKLMTLFLDVHPLTETMIMVFASRVMDNDSEIKDIEQKKLDFEFWSERADLVINLKAFSKSECKEYLKSYYKASDVHADALEFVYEKSQGNQMFTKMICSFLKENKKFLIEDETLKLKNTVLDAEILSSMSAYVQRKIDRLDDETKIALKIASVCGMEFDLSIIEAVIPYDSPINREGNIERLLTTLFVNDLLVKVGSQYKFRSSLIHSIVYESVPKDQKREIHLKLANLFTDKIENEYSDEVQQAIFLDNASLHYSFYYDDLVLEEVLTGDPLEKELELYNLCFAHHLIEKSITLFDIKTKKKDRIRELGLAIIRILENVVKYWKENSKADHMYSPRSNTSLTLRDFIKNTKELCKRRFEDLKMIDSFPYIFAKSLHQMKEHLARHLMYHSEFIRTNNVGDDGLKDLVQELVRKGIELCPPENQDLLFHLHLQNWFIKFLNDQTDDALECLPTLSDIASDNPKLKIFSEIAAAFSNYTRGCFEKVGFHSKKVIEIYSKDPDMLSQYSIDNFRNMDALLFIVSYAVRSLHALGKYQEARVVFDLGKKRSLEINHPSSLVHFLTFSCYYLLQSNQLEELEEFANRGLETDLVPPHQQLFQKFYLCYVKFRKNSDDNSMVCQDKDTAQLTLIKKMESLYASISHYNSPSLIVNYAILDCKLKYLELISKLGATCTSVPNVLASFNELMEISLKSNQENMFGELWRLKGEMKVIEMKLKLDNSTDEKEVLSRVEECYSNSLKYLTNQKAEGLKLKVLLSYLKSLQSFTSPSQSLIEKTTLELKETFQHIEVPTLYPNKDIERYQSLNI